MAFGVNASASSKSDPVTPVSMTKETENGADAVTDYYYQLVNSIGTVNDRSNSPKGKDSPESPLTCTCTGNLIQNASFESGTANWSWSDQSPTRMRHTGRDHNDLAGLCQDTLAAKN